MDLLQCKTCGAPIDVSQYSGGIYKCPYCGSLHREAFSEDPDGREAIYRMAVQRFYTAEKEYEYQEAAGLFAQIPDYKEATKFYGQCLESEAEAKKERLYQSAISLSAQGFLDATRRAISLFTDIQGYKDTDERLKECIDRLPEETRFDEELKKEYETRERLGRRKLRLTLLLLFVVAPILFSVLVYCLFYGCR